MKKLLALVLAVVLIGCGAPPQVEVPADAVKVVIKDFKFGPEIKIKAGQSVAWTNQDGAAHTATALDGSFDTGELFTGMTGVITFDKPGTYEYYCLLHPSMRGTVIVE